MMTNNPLVNRNLVISRMPGEESSTGESDERPNDPNGGGRYQLVNSL